jgi:hypothetical protein
MAFSNAAKSEGIEPKPYGCGFLSEGDFVSAERPFWFCNEKGGCV